MKNNIVNEIANMMLAQAYVHARAVGTKLRVVKLDGIQRKGYRQNADEKYLNVEVSGGIVKKAWWG